jgi:hypothetical protein
MGILKEDIPTVNAGAKHDAYVAGASGQVELRH